MGAPPGNQNAVGSGRPPNKGFSDIEVISLGKELVQWVKTNLYNPKIVHINQFYIVEKDITPSQWKSLCNDRDCFLPYYEQARVLMATKIMTNKSLSESYGNRYLDMYDHNLRAHEREKAFEKIDHEYKRKEDLAKQTITPPNDKDASIALELMHGKVAADKKIEEQAKQIEEHMKANEEMKKTLEELRKRLAPDPVPVPPAAEDNPYHTPPTECH